MKAVWVVCPQGAPRCSLQWRVLAAIAAVRSSINERSGLSEERDLTFMEKALAAAERGARCGEVPIGAVVVIGDDVVGVAHNAPIALGDPTAHAEVLALRRAARRLGNYRLTGATVYVTAEPCLMCVGALSHARVTRIVYGCNEPKSGALVSAQMIRPPGIAISQGVLAERAAALLQEFFRLRRGA